LSLNHLGAIAFKWFLTSGTDDADAASDEFINVVAEWWLVSDPAARHAITGNVNWLRKDFGFSLQPGDPQPPEFTGTGASPDALTGTFAGGVLTGDGSCAAEATATHVSTAVE
jgi:hypothetical protein